MKKYRTTQQRGTKSGDRSKKIVDGWMVSLPVRKQVFRFFTFYHAIPTPCWMDRARVRCVLAQHFKRSFSPFFFLFPFSFFFLFRRKKTTRGRISRRLKKISLLKQSRKLETLLGILKRALEKYTSRFKKANNFTYAKECLTN